MNNTEEEEIDQIVKYYAKAGDEHALSAAIKKLLKNKGNGK